MNRTLTAAERTTLDTLLSRDFPGVEKLRRQAATARVCRECDCGCPTIDFTVDPQAPLAPEANGTPVDVAVPAGGLILFVANGRLVGMEYWSVAEPRPTKFPPPEDIRWT
ncbi:hypothetical protein JMUB6875_69470 [Nocardia sp. JMUB6875]|uniref:hypothetical protein n=1 Tax=Nocardia sp. JMUB6875 TaxID=3158170 RepID=UPI0032E652C8